MILDSRGHRGREKGVRGCPAVALPVPEARLGLAHHFVPSSWSLSAPGSCSVSIEGVQAEMNERMNGTPFSPTAARLARCLLPRLISELEWALLPDTGTKEKRARPVIMDCFANFMFLLIPQLDLSSFISPHRAEHFDIAKCVLLDKWVMS